MPSPDTARDAALSSLAAHCLAAKVLIAEAVTDGDGTPMMAQLIDLLLFEVGCALARSPAYATDPLRRPSGGKNGP